MNFANCPELMLRSQMVRTHRNKKRSATPTRRAPLPPKQLSIFRFVSAETLLSAQLSRELAGSSSRRIQPQFRLVVMSLKPVMPLSLGPTKISVRRCFRWNRWIMSIKRREGRRSAKRQQPSTREAPSSKSQRSAGLRRLQKTGAIIRRQQRAPVVDLELLFGVSLVLGAWMLVLW
jgi:hypothetical protein